jgi:hypothetical protein
MTPRRPLHLRLRFYLAGFVAAGAVAAGWAVVRSSSSPDTYAVRPLPSPPMRTGALSEDRAAFSFSEQTPAEAALARAAKLTDADEREAARANIFATWAETDPRAVFLHLKAHGSGEADRYRHGIFFRQWADRDFKAAFDYAELQPADAGREELFGSLALVVARLSPAEAATIADRDMVPGPVRNETSMSILHQWARVDLARAAAWADSFPQGPLRDRALDEIDGRLRSATPN